MTKDVNARELLIRAHFERVRATFFLYDVDCSATPVLRGITADLLGTQALASQAGLKDAIQRHVSENLQEHFGAALAAIQSVTAHTRLLEKYLAEGGKGGLIARLKYHINKRTMPRTIQENAQQRCDLRNQAIQTGCALVSHKIMTPEVVQLAIETVDQAPSDAPLPSAVKNYKDLIATNARLADVFIRSASLHIANAVATEIVTGRPPNTHEQQTTIGIAGAHILTAQDHIERTSRAATQLRMALGRQA